MENLTKEMKSLTEACSSSAGVLADEICSPKLENVLKGYGLTRRDFLKLCGAIVASAGIAELTVPRVAHALEESVIGAAEGKLYPVIWMEGGSCTGCTEAFTQLQNPNIETIILEIISLNYTDTLSAGAGYSLEEAKQQTIDNGNYVLIYEGSVPTAFGGNVLIINGKPGTEHLCDAARNAQIILAVGSCAVNGGWNSGYPNPSGAMGVQQYIRSQGIETPVINIPSCPVNNEWLMSALTQVVVMKDAELALSGLDMYDEPAVIFNTTIHENCQRRGQFEAGHFVYKRGSKEEELGYCLYAIGCRGPLTRGICGVTQYNNRTSWCIASGGPCIGCCEADPMNPDNNWVEVNTPFYNRQRDIRIGDWFVNPSAIAVTITGAIAVLLLIHGFGMKLAKRVPGGPEYEKVRKWDARHPDKSIGQYEIDDMVAAVHKLESMGRDTKEDRIYDEEFQIGEPTDEANSTDEAKPTEEAKPAKETDPHGERGE